MSPEPSLFATFNVQRFTLTVTPGGTGSGTVTSSDGLISCPGTCSATYNSGVSVTLTERAGSGSTFGGWGGSCTGTSPTCPVTMSGARSVTATFNVQRFTLTVTPGGTGSGTVTSNDGLISCPGTCTATYNSGANVTLTAAAGSGSTCAGWGGACTGTSPTCPVTMSGARSVTATFTVQQFTLNVSVQNILLASGTVTSSPAGISCGSDCSQPYNSGTRVTLTATPAFLSVFVSWGGACS